MVGDRSNCSNVLALGDVGSDGETGAADVAEEVE
jgi:hypothetical protein